MEGPQLVIIFLTQITITSSILVRASQRQIPVTGSAKLLYCSRLEPEVIMLGIFS